MPRNFSEIERFMSSASGFLHAGLASLYNAAFSKYYALIFITLISIHNCMIFLGFLSKLTVNLIEMYTYGD
jgi:hypothetical protein